MTPPTELSERDRHLVAPAGLEGLVVASTAIGDVRGEEGFYHYRGLDALELARTRSFEEVAYLLLVGRLPEPDELASFLEELRPWQVLPREFVASLQAIADPQVEPIIQLRSALSLYTARRGFAPWLETDVATLRRNALELVMVFPSIVAALHRLSEHLDYVEPDPALSVPENYLYMLRGERAEPSEEWGLERYLILMIEHGFGASTFVARIVTSTGADLGSAAVAALCALSGPLHGGAPSRALDMLDEIGTTERAEPWIRDAIERGERIMGFGSRVYRGEDPRSVMLRGVAKELGGARAELGMEVESTIVRVLAELKPGRSLNANAEFFASIVLERCGIPRALFTSTFSISRILGWSAHVLEQLESNRLIRPIAEYVGPPPRDR